MKNDVTLRKSYVKGCTSFSTSSHFVPVHQPVVYYKFYYNHVIHKEQWTVWSGLPAHECFDSFQVK